MSERAWVGADFFRLPEEKQKFLLATGNMLFCRTEPKDKQRLVKMLQDMGEVCRAMQFSKPVHMTCIGCSHCVLHMARKQNPVLGTRMQRFCRLFYFAFGTVSG